MKKNMKPVASMILTAIIASSILSINPVEAFAAQLIGADGGGANSKTAVSGAKAVSSNDNKQNYSTWSKPVYSHFVENSDHTFTRFEYIDNAIIVEQYDSKLGYMSAGKISMELPLFGGVYFGKEFNFVVFGQENQSESKSKEVFKVVKYDKKWNKIGAAGLSDCNTIVPFTFGSLRMAEYGNMLYIRTSHKMYKTSDGLNHQANITFSVSVPDMEITDSFSGVLDESVGYISHSFNQFILTNGNKLAAVDQGDAYPRSIILSLYKSAAGEDTFTQGCDSVELMKLAGEVGANETGASIGGFEVSGSSYLVAGNSIIQDSNYKSHATRNIFLSVTPVNSPSNSNTSVKWLTNYSENGKPITSTPHLVKVDDSNFMVMWNEGNTVKYVVVNGNGEKVSALLYMDGSLSDCKPILVANRIVWYSTNQSVPTFYEINVPDIKTPSKLK